MKFASLLFFAVAFFVLGKISVKADPVFTRLTPPSLKFDENLDVPIIARFLPGQFFDLQATLVTSGTAEQAEVRFYVDDKLVPGTVSVNPIAAETTVEVSGTNVFTQRHVSFHTPGVKTLKAVAKVEGSAQKVTAVGNFEIVEINSFGKQGMRANNVIIMIGDGMGVGHRTAARVVSKGVKRGKSLGKLAMDTLPVTGMVETASLNSIVTDSAPGASCYSTGNKGDNNELNVFPDDTEEFFDNPRIETIGEYLARTRGKSLGIVTTSDVFDATPAAFGAHTSNRSAGTGICDQYLDEMVPHANLRVLMGGGRKWFLPTGELGSARNNYKDSVLPEELASAWGRKVGAKDSTRDLLADFQQAGFAYASTKTEMDALESSKTESLLGLFAFSNMNVALDKINGRRAKGSSDVPTVVEEFGLPDQPMLSEMTEKALQVLSQNKKGFVLMVEAASIDKQAHNMDTERFIMDTIEFDKAVETVIAFQKANPDTLVLVTADHECGGVGLIGTSKVPDSTLLQMSGTQGGPAVLRDKVVGIYEEAAFPLYKNNPVDGYPETMDVDRRLLVGYAANADRFEDWRTNPKPLMDRQQPEHILKALKGYPSNANSKDLTGNFQITGQITGKFRNKDNVSAAHTGVDVPISALGRGAHLFSGYQDNTDVFFKAMQATLGGVRPQTEK